MKTEPAAPEHPCPVCGTAPSTALYAPFCSKRCADVDLQRWFSGRYAIPGRTAGTEAESDED